MIDVGRMSFVERPGASGDLMLISGHLQIGCEMSVAIGENIPLNVLRERMREQVWRRAYGQLVEPIKRLEMLARRNVRSYPEQEEIMALCATLKGLLTRTSSLDSEPIQPCPVRTSLGQPPANDNQCRNF